MINAYYPLVVTSKKGDKIKMVFIKEMLCFEAHLEAEKQGYTTDYYDGVHSGFKIERTIESVKQTLKFWK